MKSKYKPKSKEERTPSREYCSRCGRLTRRDKNGDCESCK